MAQGTGSHVRERAGRKLRPVTTSPFPNVYRLVTSRNQTIHVTVVESISLNPCSCNFHHVALASTHRRIHIISTRILGTNGVPIPRVHISSKHPPRHFLGKSENISTLCLCVIITLLRGVLVAFKIMAIQIHFA